VIVYTDGSVYWCGEQRSATSAVRVVRIDAKTWAVEPAALDKIDSTGGTD
jgi:hypothetical protein